MANSKYPKLMLAYSSFLITGSEAYDLSKPAPTWYEAPDVGWSWYKDTPFKQQCKPKEKDKSPHQGPENEDSERSSERSYTYTQQMEKVRKDLEELQAQAILNPTLENVGKAQKAQALIMDRSTAFEKAWMMSSLLSSGNYRESDQPSPQHRKIYQEQSWKQLEEDIHTLAKTYGIFFIFKTDCPYCHEMAPPLRQLCDRYGFAVKAISPDGEGIEGFPDAVKDNGTIGQINPEGAFPMVFLVNPHSGQTIPLARGLISPSEIKENFKVIIQYLKEQPHVR